MKRITRVFKTPGFRLIMSIMEFLLLLTVFLLWNQPAFSEETSSAPGIPGFDITGRTGKVPLTSKEEFVKWRLQTTDEKEAMLRARSL